MLCCRTLLPATTQKYPLRPADALAFRRAASVATQRMFTFVHTEIQEALTLASIATMLLEKIGILFPVASLGSRA
jgi:hypothetical protein